MFPNSNPTERRSMEILTKQNLSDAPSSTSEEIFERSFQSAAIYLDICHLTRRNVYKYLWTTAKVGGYSGEPIDFRRI